MESTTTSVVGVFDDLRAAERVRDELRSNGFLEHEIEVQTRDYYPENAARGNTGVTGAGHDTSGGGISGFFRRLFGGHSDYESRYSTAVQSGQTVVSVTTRNQKRQDVAAEIMNRYGAIDVDERSASSKGGSKNTRQEHEATIPVVQQELEVDKRMVQRGGVRIFSRATEEPAEEQVKLRQEHLRVDRRPVNRAATDSEIGAGDEVIEVTEMAEEPVIRKRTRVVEEVSVRKDATEHTETIRDTVRRTDVEVQEVGAAGDDDFRRHFQSHYAASGGDYRTYAPAYEYGYRARSEQYRDRRWEDVEKDLRTDYERSHPGSTWDRVKDAARHGWNRVRH